MRRQAFWKQLKRSLYMRLIPAGVPKNSYSALEPIANLIINSNRYGTKTCYTAASDGNFIYAFSFL
jgi:hypothetical protein